MVLVAQGLSSPLPHSLRIALWAVSALVITAANLFTRRGPRPPTRRQISASTIAARDREGAFLFGGALGTGLLTYLPSWAPHVLLLSCVLVQPSVAATVAAALGFGIGRAAGL